MKLFIDSCPEIYAIIFCRTRRETQKICENLIEDGYNSGALHGDLSQNQRDLVMKSFRTKHIKILVATDVASRGIDVDNITHIIHYKIPDEVEIYNHRSGRTGRASNTGLSIAFISNSDKQKIKRIENKLKIRIESSELPDSKTIINSQINNYLKKIKDVKINSELETYFSSSENMLDEFSKSELLLKILSLKFDKKIVSPELNVEKNSKKNNEKDVRYKINLGIKDYYNWQNLKDFLTEIYSLHPGDIYNVDVQQSKSFFNSKIHHKDLIIEGIKSLDFNGRKIRVSITNKRGQKDESSFSHRDQKKKRKSRKKYY